jgi:hypothetical protein
LSIAKQRRQSGKVERYTDLVGKGERRESEEGISLVIGEVRDRDDQTSGDQRAQRLAIEPGAGLGRCRGGALLTLIS